MRWGPRVRFAHAVERWYFWEPCFCFSIFGDIKPTFGQFLEHFCYMLRNGLEDKTCFIPLGICFLNSLGNKTLFLPKIDSKWARNNCFWEIFSPLLDHLFKFLAYFAPFLTNYWYISAHFQDLFLIFRNYLGITTSFRPILAHFGNIFVTC